MTTLATGKSKNGLVPLKVHVKGTASAGGGLLLTGFTLIEVMVSVAVLSIGLMFILEGQTGMLNTIRVSENNLKATHKAESKMAQIQIKAKEAAAALAVLDEEFEDGNVKFEWAASSRAVEESESLERIEAAMSWEEGKRSGKIPIVTYIRRNLGPASLEE